MKDSRTRVPPKPKSRFVKAADSLLTIATLIMTFKAATQVHSGGSAVIEYFIVYILLALSCLVQASDAYLSDKKGFVKNVCFSSVFAAAVITSVIVNFYNEVKDERKDRNHPESKE